MNLFTPVVPPAQQHPRFRALLDEGDFFTMSVLGQWASQFVDRDGKFVKEFQTTFNSCLWELYLFAVLKRYGLQVDFTKNRPDFCVPSLKLNIEATVALNAHGTSPEHNKAPLPSDLNTFNYQTIIRLSNGVTAKFRKYVDSYVELAHVQNASYVIAIANFDQPNSPLACQRPIEALLYGYYVDEERYLATHGREGRLFGESLARVFKDNGTPIDLGLFLTPAYAEISAVIFSSCANLDKARALSDSSSTKPVFTALRQNTKDVQPHLVRLSKDRYEEGLLDGLRIYHNPHATHPLTPTTFRHPSVFQSYWKNGDWAYEQRDGQLLFRSTDVL